MSRRQLHRLSAIVFSLACAASLRPLAEEPQDLAAVLAFEGSGGNLPQGWRGGPPGTLFAETEVVHGGTGAGRIERTKTSPGQFSTFTSSIPMNFQGTTLELRGFLRTEGVDGWTGLWLREDGEGGSVAFDNMQQRGARGTTEWTQYTIRLPIEPEGQQLFFGALLSGSGRVWVDDLELRVDGKPIQEVPKVERPRTPDGGSQVAISSLTPPQIDHLALLGRVWGFLKYHHPKVVSGTAPWDEALFRVMPAVLAAHDRPQAQAAILRWATELGEVPDSDPRSLPDGCALAPDLAWIHDRGLVGEPLSRFLEGVYRNRPARGPQTYVASAPGVGNPEFRAEKAYSAPLPDPGRRILALFRWWNIVQYWSPYRDLIGEDWNGVLTEFLPRMVAAGDVDRYRMEMLALIARLNDGHANLWSALEVRPPRGDCRAPVRLRSIEGKPVVVGYTHAEKGPASGLQAGDVIVTLDGVPVARMMESWRPYYAASNDSARTAAMMDTLTQGACGTVEIVVDRGGTSVKLKVARAPNQDLDLQGGWSHDLPGPAFRRLSDTVAYLKLSEVRITEVPEYLRAAEGSQGFIVDIRNYPAEFVVFALGGHFVSEATPFARFTIGDTGNPGAFLWGEPLRLMPIAPTYPGKVVVLVDERSMSQAEYTAMALRAGPYAVVIGSTTQGADGNVSKVPLPGGLQTMISGIGVFYPDKKGTQRVGIVPDIEVRPSLAGVREGRDEILEAAVRHILGPEAAEAEVRKIARP